MNDKNEQRREIIMVFLVKKKGGVRYKNLRWLIKLVRIICSITYKSRPLLTVNLLKTYLPNKQTET